METLSLRKAGNMKNIIFRFVKNMEIEFLLKQKIILE